MKKAFTVAEALVTLVIVGVISSVMVSSVVKQKPDKTKILMRNAYAELTGVVSNLVADSVLYPDFAEFGLADSTQVTVRYAGTPFPLGDNRGKMCIGMRHYFNSITQDYIYENITDKDGNAVNIPCRASFYTKSGVKVRFEVSHRSDTDFNRFVIMDANPTNDLEITDGDDVDTVRVQVSRSGRLTIVNSAARSIINEAQVK